MRKNLSLPLMTGAALALAAGCATVAPPDELAQARATYERAQGGTAGKLMPAELYTDKHALDAAEAAFHEEPRSAKARDLSYVALRKLQATEARAATQLAIQQKAESEAQAQARLRGELKSTRDQLSAASQAMKDHEGELNRTREELTAEKTAREAAEKKLNDAVAQIAQVKEEARGTVITLSGSVLFASGKADLLPVAQTRLAPVADALKAMPNRAIVIEGFTDSRGSDRLNRELSTRRADAVRQFLVGRGVETVRVRSEGKGPSDPVADNGTAEGRANNRRVEIVLERAAQKAPDTASGGSGAGSSEK